MVNYKSPFIKMLYK
uniref:Uncharacterized protein n=1 Tax=Megaselia scalaris TaxID=36166 RepID=T1GCC8_MEGSC